MANKTLSGTTALNAMPAGGNIVVEMADPTDTTNSPPKRVFSKVVPLLFTPRTAATVNSLNPATLADSLVCAVFLPDDTALKTTLGALKTYLLGGSGGVPTLALVMPTGVQPGTSYAITGSFTNDGTTPALSVSVDAGAFGTLPAGSTVSAGTIALAMPGLTAGSHTVQVKDGNGVLSNTVSFVVTAPETLTVTTPGAQTAGTAFNVAGTYANGTPPSLDYSVDGGQSWTTAVSPTIAGGSYIVPGVMVATANSAATVKVRDHAAQSVVATSAGFVVAAPAPAPAYTYAVQQDTVSGGGFTFDYNIYLPDGTRITPSTLPANFAMNFAFSKSTTVVPQAGDPLFYQNVPWNGYGQGFWHADTSALGSIGYPFQNSGATPGDIYYPWVMTSDGASHCFSGNPHAAPS